MWNDFLEWRDAKKITGTSVTLAPAGNKNRKNERAFLPPKSAIGQFKALFSNGQREYQVVRGI